MQWGTVSSSWQVLKRLLNADAGASLVRFDSMRTVQDILNAVDGAPVAKAGKKYKVVSCVLRQDSPGTGWYALTDSGHDPVGVNSISESGGEIVINFDFTALKVVALNVTLDESYAATRLNVGASVGTSAAILSLYHPFEARVNGVSVSAFTYLGTKGIDWDMVADAAAGTWTFTHAAESHNDAQGSSVSISENAAAANIEKIAILSQSKTGFVLQAMGRIAGRASAALAITTENTGATSAAWNGTETLTITHPTADTINGVSVVSENPQYTAAVTASTQTTITVQFYNIASGALYTGASPPCGVRYMRDSLAPVSYPGGVQAYVARGPVKCPSSAIGGANANMWVYGIFEVA